MKVESSIVVLSENTFSPQVVLTMKVSPSVEEIQDLHNDHIDKLFSEIRSEIDRLEKDAKQKFKG